MSHKVAVPVLDRLGGFMRRGMTWYGKQWGQERTSRNQNRSRFNDIRRRNLQDYTIAEDMYENDEDSDNETDGEKWDVKVTMHEHDQINSKVYGTMEAFNIPAGNTSVITSWEGEVIDFVHFGLWTEKWCANQKTDLDHWRRFDAFAGMDRPSIIEIATSIKSPERLDDYILMRWKELSYLNKIPQAAGFTIAGFYYICMHRTTGQIQGYYHDTSSNPWQQLHLSPAGSGTVNWDFA